MRSSSQQLDLNRVDLNLLVAFDALMTERSVTAAAVRLNVGQSAMSSSLGRLRKLFNDPILVRDGRTMVATPTAQSLAGPVCEALAGIRSILLERRIFDPAVDERIFTVVASEHATLAILQPFLAYLTVHAPKLELRMYGAGGSGGIEQLMRRDVDLLIVPRSIFHWTDDFHQERLYVDRYVLAVDAANEEVGDSITLEEFSSMPYLGTHIDLHPSLSDIQLDFLGIPRRVEAVVGMGTAPFMLRGTELVALLPELTALQFAECAGLRLLEPPMVLQPLTEMMVWARRFDDDPAHAWLRRELRRLAEQSLAQTTDH